MKLLVTLLGVVCILILSGAVIGSIVTPTTTGRGKIVAYRGGGPSVDLKKLRETGCTATSIMKSERPLIENTLQAVAASVAAGADIIHLNIHRTADNKIVVFHDWRVDCATNGSGAVSALNYSDLKDLDAAYGYTWDNGISYPFRGKGYRISLLRDFIALYPNKEFWLNLKEDDEKSFEVLSDLLMKEFSSVVPHIRLISSDKAIEWFAVHGSNVNVLSVASTKRCARSYMLYGWTGYFPEACKDTAMLLPPNKARYFWGYPKALAARFNAYDSSVYLWYDNANYKAGMVDTTLGVGIVTSQVEKLSN